jgi:AcrR family transcriptional regulator
MMESSFDPGEESGDDSGDADERSSRAERKAQSRRRILEAARDVFFRDGFMAANLDEVAEKAGVAKGTLYRYFQSKADLYVAVLADNGNAFTERMRAEASGGGGSTMDQLRRISRFYYDYWNRHPEYFQIFWAIDNQPVIGDLPEAVVGEVTRLWEESLQVLSGVLQRGIDAGELRSCDTWEVANILWTTANALIQADATKSRRQLRRLPLEAVFQDAIELIFDGLSVRGGAA